MSLALSVVVPTRDRLDRLCETLEALADEARSEPLAGGFEVVVVDDGSADPVAASIEGLDLSFPLHVLTRPPRGPAAARNDGIAMATGERVLLLGDDTRPAPGTLRRHLDAASVASSADDVAIQGHIDWDPEAEITPLMDFLAPAGPQFYFRGLRDGARIPFSAVLGSNLSAPRAWFVDEPFDEGFPHAAVEDTELAWRWHRRGWSAVYDRRALCWHHHRYEAIEPFLDRQRRAGASARYAAAKHPSLLWPLVLQPTAFGWIVRMRRWLGQRRPTDAWDLACRRAFWQGVVRGR